MMEPKDCTNCDFLVELVEQMADKMELLMSVRDIKIQDLEEVRLENSKKAFVIEMIFRSFESRLVGIRNLGNTCYFSSVMQALLSSRKFRDHLMATQKIHQNPTQLCRVFNFMTFLDMRVDLTSMLPQLRPQHFVTGEQEDAHELIEYLNQQNVYKSSFEKFFGGIFATT